MAKRIVKLTERDLQRIVKRTINETGALYDEDAFNGYIQDLEYAEEQVDSIVKKMKHMKEQLENFSDAMRDDDNLTEEEKEELDTKIDHMIAYLTGDSSMGY